LLRKRDNFLAARGRRSKYSQRVQRVEFILLFLDLINHFINAAKKKFYKRERTT